MKITGNRFDFSKTKTKHDLLIYSKYRFIFELFQTPHRLVLIRTGRQLQHIRQAHFHKDLSQSTTGFGGVDKTEHLLVLFLSNQQ